MEEQTKIFIECECGTHLLEVTNDAEYFNDNKQVRQEFWLAMFSYGNSSNTYGFFERFKIAWKFLRTGRMYGDQITLNPDEAKKLADFINNNIIETEK